jgi:adenylyl- and sulfurtransferase ThiI
LPVVAARRGRGLDTGGFAVVVAVWLAATAGVEVRSVHLPPLQDPMAGELRAMHARHHDLRRLSHAALGARCDPGFVAEVASVLLRLTTDGRAVLGTP